MPIISVGGNPILSNGNYLYGDWTPGYASLGNITSNASMEGVNFTLTIQSYNSGATNPYFVYISSSDGLTPSTSSGSTQTINHNTGYTWSISGLSFSSGGSKTINVKLYSGSQLIDNKNYTVSITSASFGISTNGPSGYYCVYRYDGVACSNLIYVTSNTTWTLTITDQDGGGPSAQAALSAYSGSGNATITVTCPGGIGYSTGAGNYCILKDSFGTQRGLININQMPHGGVCPGP